MLGLTSCATKLFVASALFLNVNAKTNKFRLGHTISNEFRRHFQVDRDLRSLVSDGPFTTGSIDTGTIVPLINLMKDDAWELFDMTLMIPDIRGVNGTLTATRFECKNNHDDDEYVALCTADDDLKSSLIFVVTVNGSNHLITGIFNDLTRRLHYQMYTNVSKPEYSFAFSISKNEDVPMKVEGLSADALSPKDIPIIGVNNRNDIVNQKQTTVDLVGQSDIGITIIEEDTVVDVLFYYTWRAMCLWTNQVYESCKYNKDEKAQIKSLVKAYVTSTNDVFKKSLTGVRIKSTFSIGSKEGYDEEASNNDHILDDLTYNRVDDVHKLRNEKGADLVVGIAFGAKSGVIGRAWVPKIFPSRSLGFSSIASCGMNCNSIMADLLTHEIGHNFGCNHDREYDEISDGNVDSNFGFNHCTTCVTSIMGYDDHCKSLKCKQVTTIHYFSNPDIEVTAEDQNNQKYTFAIGDSKRNNAQMIRNSKKGIAANYVKGQYLIDVNSDADYYGWSKNVEFIVEGVTAVTIENLEILFRKIATEHKISISTKLIDTEDKYSLHVEETLVPMGKGSNGVLSDIASFDTFPAIKIGAGEKMRIRVKCDTKCIRFNIEEDNPIVVKNNHISVQGEFNDAWGNTLWWGAIFYKPETIPTLKEEGEECEKKSECKSNKCKKDVCKKKKTKKENGKSCNKASKCISNKCYMGKCRPSTCLDKKVICDEDSACCSLKCNKKNGTCNKGS